MKSILILLCALAPIGGPSLAAKPPNILIILADDLGRADFSAYGTKDIRTPNVDRLCREGMTFENFRANSCVCSPTRAALLTGCHPDRVGVPGVIRDEQPENSWGYLAKDAGMLPALLKQANYHSPIIGKWQLRKSEFPRKDPILSSRLFRPSPQPRMEGSFQWPSIQKEEKFRYVEPQKTRTSNCRA
jgi:arylsulfatase A-like enzyme